MEMKRVRVMLYVFLGVLIVNLAGCNLPTVSHDVGPGPPVYEQFVSDCKTDGLVEPGELIQPVPGCDSWEINRYERPFNAGTQDEYYPDLDILYAELGRDNTWFYLSLALEDVSEDTEKLDGSYGIEIDWDRDGRGDILIAVETPGKYQEESWSVLGVQVWTDNNDDVGNTVPREPDLPYLGDGYNILAFNQGDGSDPDAAWARAFLGKPAVAELAFKSNLLENPDEFVWWVWSDQGVANPAGFDYHDTFENEEAGDANDYMPYFPSNQVYELDNTCAALWGLPPDDDPNLCINDPNYALFEPPPDRPTATPTGTDSVTETPTGTLLTPTETPTSTLLTRTITATGTLLTPTDTLDIPLYTFSPTPLTETPTRTPYYPCDFDCDCEPEQGENPNNCSHDCPDHCGNDECDCGETKYTCSDDCGRPPCTCGDGYCNGSCGEDDANGNNYCKEDCS
ncbi:MAG: hypothetical protein PVF83_12535 [Anaerolineales bacterium]|jgi:hypothetical protein